MSTPASHLDKANSVLVIGATSGIGRAIAERFAKVGRKVVVTGRREEKLKEIKSQYQNVSTAVWDVSDLPAGAFDPRAFADCQSAQPRTVPAKVNEIFKKHSGINSVFLVSGMQRTTDFTKPKELDMQQIDIEITTNFTACVSKLKTSLAYSDQSNRQIHLIAALLPHLQQAPSPVLAVITSQLAIVPMPRTPVYNAAKAACHQFVLGMRAQLQQAKSPVAIVDILPPSVATELHASHNQPDLPDDYPEMPLDDFMNELWAELDAGKLDIPIGAAKSQWAKVEGPRIELLEQALSK